MKTSASIFDLQYRDAFVSGKVTPAEFHHRDHLRLAFVYLCETDIDTARQKLRSAIKKFLADNAVNLDKYHETLTTSWLQAVRHFMERAGKFESFDEFLRVDNRLLDSDIMLSHYTRARLFSDAARLHFVVPDLQPIPQYESWRG